MSALPLLTSSRLKTARACLRLDKMKYQQGYRSVQDVAALRFGTLVHAGLEAWMMAPLGARLGAAMDAIVAAGEPDPFEYEKARALMIGYDARWGGEQLEVLAVEQEFTAPLINPDTGAASKTWRLSGKLDALVRDQHGRTLIMEHKTSAEDIRQGSDYWKLLKMDGQISIYFAGARALGHDVEGCIYDVIGKPSIRPLKATPLESRKFTKDGALYKTQREVDETPAEYGARLKLDIESDPNAYYQRGEVVRLESEIAESMADSWQFARLLADSIRLNRAPRNPDACRRYHRVCEFFDACTGSASLDDRTLFTLNSNVHPELTVVAEPTSKEEAA